MKGLILAAGKGSRLAELNLEHKSLGVINKKHIIDYSLDLLSNEGGARIVSEIIIVVGHNAQAVMDYVGDSYKGIPVKFVYQAERKGVAHAVKTAKDALNDDFIMCLADELLFNPRLEKMVEAYSKVDVGCMCGVVVDGNDFSAKPIAYDVDEQGYVKKIVEKATEHFNDYRGVGECIFSRKALDYLEDLQPNPVRGEYEMGDWMTMIVNGGDGVKIFDLADGYCNVNYAADIQKAEAMIAKN